MTSRIYLKLFIVLFLILCGMTEIHAQFPMRDWTPEEASGKLHIVQNKDTMEIIAYNGLTLWYNHRLTGDYQIKYKVKMIMAGNDYDRLSDLNCFWGANDPKNPENIFADGHWRRGLFDRYNSLNLYYVGYGGNHNSTTRFRKYYSEYFNSDKDKDKVRPIIKEYKDNDHLLKPNKWYEICIYVRDNKTSYIVNGEVFFEKEIEDGECDGHFGFRLLKNHTVITDISFTKFVNF